MPALFLLLACAMWGLSFPLVKALQFDQLARLPDASGWFLTCWIQSARCAIGALLMLPFLIRSGLPSLREFRQGSWIAFFGGTGLALQVDGLAYTQASTSAFLTQAYCVVLPLVVCLRSRKWPTRRVIAATLLIIAGCAVLSGFGFEQTQLGRGEIETLVSAVFFALMILTLENPKFRGNRCLPVTWVMNGVIAALFLPLAWISAPSPEAVLVAACSLQSMTMSFCLAAFCSVGAFLLMNHWQPRISAVEAGVIYSSEPVFTALYSLFLPAWLSTWAAVNYPNESFTLALILGGGLIISANLLMQSGRKPHRPSIAPAP
ncbi:MAG: DMT family transporter [Luteolibacter sp.]